MEIWHTLLAAALRSRRHGRKSWAIFYYMYYIFLLKKKNEKSENLLSCLQNLLIFNEIISLLVARMMCVLFGKLKYSRYMRKHK